MLEWLLSLLLVGNVAVYPKTVHGPYEYSVPEYKELYSPPLRTFLIDAAVNNDLIHTEDANTYLTEQHKFVSLKDVGKEAPYAVDQAYGGKIMYFVKKCWITAQQPPFNDIYIFQGLTSEMVNNVWWIEHHHITYLENLRNNKTFRCLDDEWYMRATRETERAKTVWQQVAPIANALENSTVANRPYVRDALQTLYDALGPEAYYSGSLPHPIPYWTVEPIYR